MSSLVTNAGLRLIRHRDWDGPWVITVVHAAPQAPDYLQWTRWSKTRGLVYGPILKRRP